MKKYIIIADGDYPTHGVPLSLLSADCCVVCCDHAARTYHDRTGRMPQAVVGDGDSLPEADKALFGSIWHHVAEQETNDLTKATKYVTEHFADARTIYYLAATGKREDHTLGNIALMNHYKNRYAVNPVMVTDYGTFTLHDGDAVLETFARQQISIFNVSATEITSEGLKWAAVCPAEQWQATLNEALGAKVTLHANGRYLVYRTHEAK